MLLFSVLAFHTENNAKPRFAAHHPLVRLGHTLQRENFIHRLHTGKRTELERILRIQLETKVAAKSFWNDGQPVQRRPGLKEASTPRIYLQHRGYVLYGVEETQARMLPDQEQDPSVPLPSKMLHQPQHFLANLKQIRAKRLEPLTRHKILFCDAFRGRDALVQVVERPL